MFYISKMYDKHMCVYLPRDCCYTFTNTPLPTSPSKSSLPFHARQHSILNLYLVTLLPIVIVTELFNAHLPWWTSMGQAPCLPSHCECSKNSREHVSEPMHHTAYCSFIAYTAQASKVVGTMRFVRKPLFLFSVCLRSTGEVSPFTCITEPTG